VVACVAGDEAPEQAGATLDAAARLRAAATLLTASHPMMHSLPSAYAIVEPPPELEEAIHVGQPLWDARDKDLQFESWASPGSLQQGRAARGSKDARSLHQATAICAHVTGDLAGRRAAGGGGDGVQEAWRDGEACSDYEAEWLRTLREEVNKADMPTRPRRPPAAPAALSAAALDELGRVDKRGASKGNGAQEGDEHTRGGGASAAERPPARARDPHAKSARTTKGEAATGAASKTASGYLHYSAWLRAQQGRQAQAQGLGAHACPSPPPLPRPRPGERAQGPTGGSQDALHDVGGEEGERRQDKELAWEQGILTAGRGTRRAPPPPAGDARLRGSTGAGGAMYEAEVAGRGEGPRKGAMSKSELEDEVKIVRMQLKMALHGRRWCSLPSALPLCLPLRLSAHPLQSALGVWA